MNRIARPLIKNGLPSYRVQTQKTPAHGAGVSGSRANLRFSQQSGQGRKGSKYGIEDYLEIKHVSLSLFSDRQD
ncbi:hypothetical protein C3E97_032395, partial [Pseudomonas sp. MWU12-2115]